MHNFGGCMLAVGNRILGAQILIAAETAYVGCDLVLQGGLNWRAEQEGCKVD